MIFMGKDKIVAFYRVVQTIVLCFGAWCFCLAFYFKVGGLVHLKTIDCDLVTLVVSEKVFFSNLSAQTL